MLLGRRLFQGLILLALSATVPAHAQPPAVEACATRSDVLGLSRIVEVDAAKAPSFGRTPQGNFDFLEDGEIVLTFDDGPLRAHTRAVLDALDAHCTKATFFMVGRMAVSDPAMVREVARRGHTVGGHTWSHARLTTLDVDGLKDEVEMGFSAVARAMQGPIAPFFRYPYLRASQESADYLKSRSLASFGIDVDSRDFETRDGAAVKARVLSQLAKRRKGIILLHDIQLSTARSIKDILDALKSAGFKVVHLVPKQPATTIKDYDTLADRELQRRKLASDKAPLASRSVVWAQSEGAGDGEEVLPWSRPGGDDAPKKAKATNGGEGVPWIPKWLQP